MTNIPPTGARGRTLTAFFDTSGAADQAIADLEAAGIPRQHIHRVDGATTSGEAAGTSSTGETGFLASLKDLFMPEEDRYGYAEGLGRGGYLVSVTADEANFARVTDILDRDGAVDMDQREASWRKEGWTGYAATARQASTGTAAPAAGAPAAKAGDLLAANERGIEDTAAARTSSGDAEHIPVVEERLNVGKRDVSHGRVRLRSYVVETPVEERVSLHDEAVQVDRRRVDRPVTAADEALFAEKTIELEEHAEEAVVSKEARVVEEIALRKEASDRVETIRDTVRRTDVEVEDERGRTGSAGAGAAARFADRIRGDMEVVGSDGAHVGIVDRLDGGRIKLKAADTASGGGHHYLTHDLVQSVAGKVMLAVTAAEAKARWATA